MGAAIDGVETVGDQASVVIDESGPDHRVRFNVALS
jgi:hypothetical protein